MTKDLTVQQTFEHAYAFFNEQLFGGELPECMVVLHRKRGARGYFWQDQWTARKPDGTLDEHVGRHEIAMVPDTFSGRSTKDIMSTLVHEMCHLQEQEQGKPTTTGHGRGWVAMMDAVGLLPYAIGCYPEKDADGQWIRPRRQSGRKVSHVIVEGGPFDKACDALLATGVDIIWSLKPATAAASALAAKKKKSKTKYTCPACGANAWAKPESLLICGVDMETLEEAE